MSLSLLCLTSFLPLLSGSTVGLYDGLLSAYLSFRQERLIPEGRRSMPPNDPAARPKPGNDAVATEADMDAVVRNMLKVGLVKYSESDENNEVVWKFPDKLISEEEKQICGVATKKMKDSANSLSRIVGGTAAQHGAWPWIVALGYKVDGGIKYMCGGTLITQKHILTAAHCVHENPSLHSALLGASEFRNATEQGARHILIASRRVHEAFNSSIHANDIAVLTLEIPVTFTNNIRAACLPLSDLLRDSDYRSHDAFVAGWGLLQYNGQVATTLQQLEVPILDEEDCRKAYVPMNQVIDSRIICAGYMNGSKDACQGDSGGPLVWEHGGAYYVIGVVSYGYHCAEVNYPGVYTRVSHFTDWIHSAIYSLH